MATIPIEVIVRDETSPVEPTPTPTPTDPSDPGENTNITVPETGAGIVDSNNGNSMSSLATIIVSIVVAVLAIGAVIALLIRKYNKRNKANTEAGMTRQEKRAMVATSTIAVLALTVLLGQLVVAGVVSPIATNAATDDTASDEADYIDVADKISIVVERAEDSEETVAKVTNTSYVTSAADFGYKVLLSMAEGVETSNLYLNGDEDSEYYIASVNSEETVETETNIWGYALEEDGEYSAMPLLDDAIVVAQGDEPVEDEEMTIYYGVKISKDLPNGTYSGGKIEYSLESIDPTIDSLTYMQDFARLSDDGKNSVLGSMPEETTYTLKDKRDEQNYTIAKLKDGRVWMTKNLNLAGGSEITSELSDVPEGYVLPVENGFQEGNKLPESDSESFDNQTKAALYNTGNDTTDCSAPGCYSYYSWHAATVGSGVDITEAETDAPYSICPRGWKLPNSRNTVAGNSDYYQLAVAYGMDPDNVSQNTSIFYEQAGLSTVPNFLPSGYYDTLNGGFLGGNQNGKYLSATFAYGGWYKHLYYFMSPDPRFDNVSTDSNGMFRQGLAVRCFVR